VENDKGRKDTKRKLCYVGDGLHRALDTSHRARE